MPPTCPDGGGGSPPTRDSTALRSRADHQHAWPVNRANHRTPSGKTLPPLWERPGAGPNQTRTSCRRATPGRPLLACCHLALSRHRLPLATPACSARPLLQLAPTRQHPCRANGEQPASATSTCQTHRTSQRLPAGADHERAHLVRAQSLNSLYRPKKTHQNHHCWTNQPPEKALLELSQQPC